MDVTMFVLMAGVFAITVVSAVVIIREIGTD